MKYGIFGGTFDPFTPAHYEMVCRCLSSGEVDKVIVVPTVVDYYRKGKTALFNAEHRRQVLEYWRTGFEAVGLSDRVLYDYYEYDVILKKPAIEVESRRYVHMLKRIVGAYGKNNEYFTIIGGDSLENFQTWHRWQDVLKLSKLIAFQRNGDIIDMIGNPISCTILTIDRKLSGMSASAARRHLLESTEGMGCGPNSTALELYLNEVNDYLQTGKTWLDYENARARLHEAYDELKQKAHDEALHRKEDKLMKIAKVLQDNTYKDVECKYSLVEDIMTGKI